MDLFVAPRVRARTTLVWLTVTGAVVALGIALKPTLRALAHSPGPTFADLLVQVCAAGSLIAALALWAAATSVASEVLRHGRIRGTATKRIGATRQLVLIACGITALTTVAPAQADTIGTPDAPLSSRILDGLPLPDRAVGSLTTPTPATASAGPDATTVTVRAGDSLWRIAARRLSAAASDDEIDSYWRRIHAVNRAAIGPDPDLIRPGQTLRIPPP